MVRMIAIIEGAGVLGLRLWFDVATEVVGKPADPASGKWRLIRSGDRGALRTRGLCKRGTRVFAPWNARRGPGEYGPSRCGRIGQARAEQRGDGLVGRPVPERVSRREGQAAEQRALK